MWMSCLFTLVSRTMELSIDVNEREETKGFRVCPCSWAWICLACVWGCVCVREGGGECVQVSLSEKQEGTLSQWSVSHIAGLPGLRWEGLP